MACLSRFHRRRVTRGDGLVSGARARPQAAARSAAEGPGEDVGEAEPLPRWPGRLPSHEKAKVKTAEASQRPEKPTCAHSTPRGERPSATERGRRPSSEAKHAPGAPTWRVAPCGELEGVRCNRGGWPSAFPLVFRMRDRDPYGPRHHRWLGGKAIGPGPALARGHLLIGACARRWHTRWMPQARYRPPKKENQEKSVRSTQLQIKTSSQMTHPADAPVHLL